MALNADRADAGLAELTLDAELSTTAATDACAIARGDVPLSGDEHRMATAGALVGLVVPCVRIDDIACTDKTIPDCPGRWAALVEG